MSIRVVIADDHPLVRDGLRLSIERSGLDIAIVGEAADGLEVLRLARSRPVDVFVLDVTMPKLNGIETARELTRRSPAARIVLLSVHDTKPIVEAAWAAGARGYLCKEIASQNVVAAVTEVHAGRSYFCPRVARFAGAAGRKRSSVARGGGRGAKSAALTRQERRVLQLIAEGQSTKEIAAALERSVNTIHAHRTNLMAKLNLHKQADLLRYAVKAGIAKL